MNEPALPDESARVTPPTTWQSLVEVSLLVMLFFLYAGDLPPMVNEAHYLVKAKNYWQPDWCSADLFAASGKAHTTFYAIFGWPTRLVSLEATAWMGRFVGWTMLAIGLHQLCWQLFHRRFICLGVAVIWIAGVEHGNLAGEWVVGGIEAKVPAYGLMLMALAELVRRRWNRVWIFLGMASAIHVLTGGWSVIAAMIAWLTTERGRQDRHRLITSSLLLGGLISLLGLVPAVTLTLGTAPEDSAAAARIYSYFRLKHHLLPADFAFSWYLRHGVMLLVVAAAAARFGRKSASWNRLLGFTLGAVIIAACGLIVGGLPMVIPDLAAKLLRYYWFRLSDAVVPLTLALLAMRMVFDKRRVVQSIGIGLLVAAILLVAQTSYRKARLGVPPSASNELLGWDASASPDQQQQVFRDWLAVCRWVRASSQPDEVFLTPRHQQTFKWYAGRAEVVNWKDVPQDAKSLREWYNRFRDVFPERLGTVRVTIQYSQLRQYRQRYGVRFLIVDRRVAGPNLPLVRVYPSESDFNTNFAVYELPR